MDLDLSYVLLPDDLSTDEFDTREELAFALGSQLNENWSILGAHRRDLQTNDALSTSVGLTYQDECFLFTVEGRRTYHEDREISQEDSIMVKVVFKHLGEVGAQ